MVPDAIGRKTLCLRVVPPRQDTYPATISRKSTSKSSTARQRSCLFAGGPTREYQFLRNQLRRDKDMIVDVLLQTGEEGMSQDANEILEGLPRLARGACSNTIASWLSIRTGVL